MDAARRERRHHHRKTAAAAAAGTAPGGVGGTGGPAAATAAAYGDVFGGPPRFAAPFGAAPVDYAEVFGGVAAACSIPFLDLPPAAAADYFACKDEADFGEIFARFDFALPYEDLFFGAPDPEREPEIASSSSGSSRSSIYKESCQLEDEAPILPQQHQNLDNVQHFEDHKVSPISFHPDTAGQHFAMSYNKTAERRPDDLVEMSAVEPPKDFVIHFCNLSHGPETDHVSRLFNGIMANSDTEENISSVSLGARSPENEFAVGQKQRSPSSPPISVSVSANENHTGPETNHVSRFDNGTMANSDNEKNTSAASMGARSPDSQSAAGQKQKSPSSPPISVSVSANENHTGPETNHVSRFDNGAMANSDNEKNTSAASMGAKSPDSQSAAGQKQQSPRRPISGSVSANENHTNSHSMHISATNPDYAFLRVSDDVQTQPIKLRPSLRQQPNLLNKEQNVAKGDANHVNQFIPTSLHSSLRSNVPQADKKADADANPALASAAMKEAIDFAEARLKAAKELLERKGDSFKLSKKPSNHRSTRSTETKAPVPVEVDASQQKLSLKKLLKEEKNVEDSLSDKHKKISASRLDHSDKRVLEKPQQMMECCTESCQPSSKIEKLGNWRSGDEFFELTGDDQKYKTDKATVQDDNYKQMSVSKDKKSETEFSSADPDFERYEKLWEVNNGTDVGGKHANLREDDTDSVDKNGPSVISETSSENMARQETHSSRFEGLVTPENAKESHDDVDDECVELPSMMGSSTKLDSTKDVSGLLSEAYSSGNHATILRDLGNRSPNVSPVSGTSQEHTNSKLVSEVSCDGGVQCTSGSNKHLQETPEVSNPDISPLSNISSLILEELGGSYVCDATLRGLSTVDQEVETYGREKFSFSGESFLHNKYAETKEVTSEEIEKVEIEKKDDPRVYPEDAAVDLNAECPEEVDITLRNKNLTDCEESDMLNVFEAASKLIKRDLDQEIRESSGHAEVKSRMEEGISGFISDLKSKEAEETPLENREKTSTEEGYTHGNLPIKSSESTVRGQTDLYTKCNTTVEEVGSESVSNSANDSTTTTTIALQDEAASYSDMYTGMQHSVQKDESVSSQTPNKSDPDVEEHGQVCSEGERELPREKSTCEENKNSVNKLEENYITSTIPKAEHGPSPLEKTRSLPRSAEGPTPVSAEAMKKETLGVQRAKERENISRTERTSEKHNGSSQRTEQTKEGEKRLQKEKELAEEKERKTEESNESERKTEEAKESERRTEEAKESERRSQKEKELAEEKERRKLEEEEMERERKKDRLAVERATREAHERAFAEAREKAEKMAFERISAARQRASAEAREKEERASAEARIKAERAAVERATAEARERAIEKAKAEKALADARERRERYRSSFKERSTNQDLRQDMQFQRATSSNFNRKPDSGNKAVIEVESALRHKARLERHQRTAERATKALAEKNMRDMLAQREQAEKHRLSEFLDPEIKRWSNGKEGNLRALLSTLQYILGAESGWQPVPLTDLITAAAVKKAYRKATLCVHPDKLQQRGATIRQKYICEKVFDLLKDAWNKFTSEER